MTRFAITPVLAVVIGLPLWIESSAGVGIIAVIASAFLVTGIARMSLSAATAGGTTSLVALTLALSESSSSISLSWIILFGASLLALADGVHCAGRMDGARIDRSVWRRQFGRRAFYVAVGAGIAAIIAALGSAGASALPSLGRPIVAGVGALITFTAVMGFVWPRESGGDE